jgi:hypothetical protein
MHPDKYIAPEPGTPQAAVNGLTSIRSNRLSKPEYWCVGTAMKNEYCENVSRAAEATQFSLLGAIWTLDYMVNRTYISQVIASVIQELDTEINPDDKWPAQVINRWEDKPGRTYEDVINVIDLTIRRLEMEISGNAVGIGKSYLKG